MHHSLLTIVGALALVQAQKIELDKVAAAPGPSLVSAPLVIASDDPPDVEAPPVKPITKAAAVAAAPTKLRRARRSAKLLKRDGDCSLEPAGAGPVPSPDTPEAFLSSPDISGLATSAPMPDGYGVSFTNQHGSLSASNYMGLTTLNSFDTLSCASLCDQADGCQAFNMYAERDPSKNPDAQQCPNPASTTNFKCTLWGSPVSQSQATNTGQYRDSFHVVIAASNAYNKTAPPPAINGYTDPTELGGAIEAPLDAQGHDTYMGFQFFPFNQAQGYTPQTCADACGAQTVYNSQHPASDGTYQTCVFFNAYVLSKNAIPQGLYCSLYNQTWTRNYGTNYGQTRGSDRYTVSRSYSYSLTKPPSNPSDGGGSGSDPCSSPAKLINGGFEDGNNSPVGWSVHAPAGITYNDISPGSTLAPADGSASNGGQFAFSGVVGPSGYDLSKSLILSQTVPTCAGKQYQIDYQYRFDGSKSNYCSLNIFTGQESTGISNLNPDYSVGVWYAYSTVFTAQQGKASSTIQFQIDCRDAAARVALDNITLKKRF